jgi:hypothetical protein
MGRMGEERVRRRRRRRRRRRKGGYLIWVFRVKNRRMNLGNGEPLLFLFV